jgi:hypothetical protein
VADSCERSNEPLGSACCSCRGGCDGVSELRPKTGLFFMPQMTYEYGEPLWNDTDRKNLTIRGETCPRTTLSTKNPTFPHLGANSCYSFRVVWSCFINCL